METDILVQQATCTRTLAGTMFIVEAKIRRVKFQVNRWLKVRTIMCSSAHPTTYALQHLQLLPASHPHMQGTNAHVVMGMSTIALAHCTPVHLPWQRQRYWFVQPAHPMLHFTRADSINASVTFHIAISLPRLAFLRDHIVAGRMMLPAAAMLEMTAACTKSLLLGEITLLQVPDLESENMPTCRVLGPL